MKKSYLWSVLAAGVLLSASCSKEDELSKEEGDDTAQVLTINIASGGDGLTARSGRPLYGSNADQSIENVQVFIYNEADQNKIVYAKAIDTWDTSSAVYDDPTFGHGRQYTLSLKGDDKLADGTYKVMAVGYSNGTVYTFDPKFANLTKDQTFSAISGTTTDKAEEVFAGETDLKVTDGAFDLTLGKQPGVLVTLHRQVAGGFGYFSNIPAKVGALEATTLRLVARKKNLKVKFENFNSAFATTGTGVQYVVNGDSPATADAKFNGMPVSLTNDAFEVYSINLSDWFTGGDTDGDGFLTKTDTWVHPASVKTAVVKGSVFAGEFMIPFALEAGKSSMELQLLDADGTILKSWNVKLATADLNRGDTATGAKDEDEDTFNVVRNHMYNLGVKTTHKPTDPENPDPENPDPGVDEPSDLSKAQDLILLVNDNWEAIHKMEIE